MIKSFIALCISSSLCAYTAASTQTLIETQEDIEDFKIYQSSNGLNAVIWTTFDDECDQSTLFAKLLDKPCIQLVKYDEELDVLSAYLSDEGRFIAYVEGYNHEKPEISKINADLKESGGLSIDVFNVHNTALDKIKDYNFTLEHASFDKTGKSYLFFNRDKKSSEKFSSQFLPKVSELVFATEDDLLNQKLIYSYPQNKAFIPLLNRLKFNLDQDGSGLIVCNHSVLSQGHTNLIRLENFQPIQEVEKLTDIKGFGFTFETKFVKPGYGALTLQDDNKAHLVTFSRDREALVETLPYEVDDIEDVTIDVDENGNTLACVLVMQDDEYFMDIFLKRPDSNWEKVSLFDRALKRTENFFYPQMTHDNQGHFVIVWFNQIAQDKEVYIAALDQKTLNWSDPQVLIPANVKCIDYELNFTKDGQAQVLYLTRVNQNYELKLAALEN